MRERERENLISKEGVLQRVGCRVWYFIVGVYLSNSFSISEGRSRGKDDIQYMAWLQTIIHRRAVNLVYVVLLAYTDVYRE